MYLRSRDSIVLNSNPFMSFIDDPKTEYNNQLVRSTNMLISALRFLKSLRAGILEPEVYHLNPAKSNNDRFRTVTRLLPSAISWYGAYFFKAFPLDMSQYSNLFNATRIPEKDKDRLFKDESAKHILVIKNGNFFTFDVFDQNGNILDAGHIYKCMKYIVEDIKVTTPDFPVSYLTSENRNTWANAREQMMQCGNSSAMNRIDSALFALILDDAKPGSDPINLFRNMLYGDGSNRWFDKCFQLIVAKDGKAAVNFEHSWGDGVAVLRFFNEIFQDSTQNPRITPNYSTNAKVDPSQSMAYHRQTGCTVASYESCSTSAFRHGRTETIRPATSATKECSEAFSKTPLSSNLRPLLDKCSSMHNELTKNAAMGQGFDRHLFALKYLAAEKNMKMPAIFKDSSYQLINHIIISTSTLSSPAAEVGGFGPVVKDGLGIGYLITDDMAASVVTSYPPNRDGPDSTPNPRIAPNYSTNAKVDSSQSVTKIGGFDSTFIRSEVFGHRKEHENENGSNIQTNIIVPTLSYRRQLYRLLPLK
uniref:Choline/carnitine acyltransferase domain-containing protein n=1 Tax=Strigamia maritima TaxID=126957 RepID=T1J4G2_STRMM